MMMGKKRLGKDRQGSSPISTKSQFAPRPFSAPEPSWDKPVAGAQEREPCCMSFKDIDILPRSAVQPKLVLGPAGDRYEREADLVAQQVVTAISSERLLAQRPERSNRVQRISLPSSHISVPQGPHVAPETEASILQARSGGQPLPDGVRQPMERAFGVDFSGVRVHADSQANRLNRSIQARAFTTGRDIFLRQGEYRPASSEGRRLLAHELTHVVQQGRVKPMMHMMDGVSANNDSNEKTISDADPSSIQRYLLSNGDATNLVEEKYGSADFATGIRFSKFSSCIGIVGTKNGAIVGAHLVRVGKDNNGPDIASVTSALSGIDNGMMFGFLNNWEIQIKSEIASNLGIVDWIPKETQNRWQVTWVNNAWVIQAL